MVYSVLGAIAGITLCVLGPASENAVFLKEVFHLDFTIYKEPMFRVVVTFNQFIFILTICEIIFRVIAACIESTAEGR